jgi:hypothetical protein
VKYINPDPPDEIRRQIRLRRKLGVYSARTLLRMYRSAMQYWRES